jgi:archaellum component FlaC
MNKTFILFLLFTSLLSSSFSITLVKKKNQLKTRNVLDDIVGFADKATGLLKEVSASGQTVTQKLSPLKGYYDSLTGVLGNFKTFLTDQTNIVTPSVSDSQTNFNDIESKFSKLSTLAKTVSDAIDKYGNYLPNTDATGKFKTVSNQVYDISQKITKYKGYSDKINNIIKEINENFNVMKKFDDEKIVELKKFVGDFDSITSKLETATGFVNDLAEVTSKASNVKNTINDAKDKVSNLLGSLW